jgi:hypothetical protein
VDRIGCAWLIRRFVDRDAEFLFVPRDQSPLPPDAEPFDIVGVRLSHHEGHGSFCAILGTYDLTDPILERIARMIDEVDALREPAIEPAAVGLDLICRGVRRISDGDQAAIDRGAFVYEALYAELAAEQS